jgi:hypothetical protein
MQRQTWLWIAVGATISLRLSACRNFADASSGSRADGGDAGAANAGASEGGAPGNTAGSVDGGKMSEPPNKAGQANAGAAFVAGAGGSAGAGGAAGMTGDAGHGGDVDTTSPLAPSTFPGLSLWLEASETSCGGGIGSSGGAGAGGLEPFRCLDASGHGNDAVETENDVPALVDDVINGHAVLRFTADPTALSVADAESLRLGQDPFAILLVARWHNSEVPVPGYGGAGFILVKTSQFNPFPGIVLWANYPQIFSDQPAMTRLAAQLEQGSAFALSASNHLNDDEFRVYVVRRRTPTEVEIRINGRSDAKAQISADLDVSAIDQPLIVGGYHGAAFAGDLAELAIIAGQISDDEQERLERFFLDKYRLAPATAP